MSGNIISSRKYLKRCLSLCLISVLQCSIHFPCPSLRSWLQRLKSAVFSVLQEDRSRGKSSTAHVNTFPMIRWVLRRIRDGGQTLLHNDMEPGFCFIRHSEARDIAISSLVPGSHEESHFLDLWLPGMMMAYSVIAKGIEELHNKRIDMCIFRGPVVLRKALDQFVSIEKNNVLLKTISWQGFRGSSRVRQQFRESDGRWLNGVHE